MYLLKNLIRVVKAKMSKGLKKGPSSSRIESNTWLRRICMDIRGHVLSIGSGNDDDGQGGKYRYYFPLARQYTTSEVSDGFDCDLVLDVRKMPELQDASFDCIYCSGVLEHVDDFHASFSEITRILKTDGILLIGLPFRQAIHMAPNDYWRFSEYGIRALLKDHYVIIEIAKVDQIPDCDFPSAYWTMARKVR